MKLKTKILGITAIISLMILILATVMQVSLISYNRDIDKTFKIISITNNFIVNFNNKSNFFLTKDLTKLKNNKAILKKTIDTLTTLITAEKNKEIREKYILLKKQFQTVSKLTLTAIEYEKEIGLTEEQGIRKKLRDAVHKLETTITQINNKRLLSELLMLRRREKNFIIRKQKTYIDKWQKNYTIMQKDLFNSKLNQKIRRTLIQELTAYQNYFNTFARMTMESEKIKSDINKLVEQRIHTLRDIETATYKNSKKLQRFMTIFSLIISLAIIVITTLLLYFSMRTLLKPIYRIREFTKYLSRGDFRHNLEVHSRDEMGELAHDINEIVLNLRRLIGDIVQSVKLLNSVSESLRINVDSTAQSARNIRDHADKTKDLVEDQAASVTETSAAVEQMTRNIESLNESIEKQTTSINQSSSAIEEMVSSINSVTNTTENASDTVEKLKEASNAGRIKLDKVNEIILNIAKQSENLIETNKIIANISSQTNLLAMNAAIEAAHAGESGKGFAVVADEIRNLAEQSAIQSKEIEKNLKGIKELIDSVVDSSGEAQKSFGVVQEHVDIVTRVIDEIKQSMVEQAEGSRQILEALKEMNDITSTVNTGSNEMKIGSEQILESITNLNRITQETQDNINDILESISEINQAIDNIGDLTNQNVEFTKDVNRSIEVFKIEEEEEEDNKEGNAEQTNTPGGETSDQTSPTIHSNDESNKDS